MTVFLSLMTGLGWRGAVGASVAGVIAMAVAFPAGRWVERQVCAERIAGAVTARDIKQMEMNDARLDTALRARRLADGDDDIAADGGLPDDGFRRD